MKKLTLFILLTSIVILSGCSISNLFGSKSGTGKNIDTGSQTCSITSNTCGEQSGQIYTMLTGTYSGNQENMLKIIKIFDDLNVIDNSYGYLSEKAGRQSLMFDSGDKLFIQSGNIFLKKKGKTIKLLSSDKKDSELGGVLGLNDKVVSLFGPYKNVFKTGDLSFVYLTKSSYGDGLKQHLYSIKEGKELNLGILLYHDKLNKLVIATMKPGSDKQYNYENIVVYKNGNVNIVLSGGFDSFSYNGKYLFASKIVGSDMDKYDVFKIDLSNLSFEKVLENKNIGHEGRFFIDNGIVYVSFGIVDFVSDSVSHHISAFQKDNGKLLWEAKIND